MSHLAYLNLSRQGGALAPFYTCQICDTSDAEPAYEAVTSFPTLGYAETKLMSDNARVQRRDHNTNSVGARVQLQLRRIGHRNLTYLALLGHAIHVSARPPY